MDSDGLIDVEDSCPEDPLNDHDSDGLCAGGDPCPHDLLNDVDSDNLCESEDKCIFDAGNDADNDSICGVSHCVDMTCQGSSCAWSDGPCASYRQGGANEGECMAHSMCNVCPCACEAECFDKCAEDAENDVDSDGLCGNEDPCPYDILNDVDSDNFCESEDICMFDEDNDADSDSICAVSHCVDMACEGSLCTWSGGPCASYRKGEANEGMCTCLLYTSPSPRDS